MSLAFGHTILYFNPLPNGEILDKSKLKAFADDKLDIAQVMISVFNGEEIIVGKSRKC